MAVGRAAAEQLWATRPAGHDDKRSWLFPVPQMLIVRVMRYCAQMVPVTLCIFGITQGYFRLRTTWATPCTAASVRTAD